MKFCKVLVVLTIFLGMGSQDWGSQAFAQSSPTAKAKLDHYFINAQIYGLGWCTEKWTGTDKPYLAIRKIIDRQSSSANSNATVERYRKLAGRTPRNPEAQFRFAYAAWLFARKSTDGQQVKPLMVAAGLGLSGAKSPGCYEFSRLRWLVEQYLQPPTNHMPMIGMGKRLIQRNPNDSTLKLSLVKELGLSQIKSDKTILRLRYGQKLYKESPNDPRVVLALASVYGTISVITESSSYAAKEEATYQRYLAMTPATYYPDHRKFVETFRLRHAKRRKLEYAKKQ